MIACSGRQEVIERENIAVIEKYIQAVQSKDTETMSELLADDYIRYGIKEKIGYNKATKT